MRRIALAFALALAACGQPQENTAATGRRSVRAPAAAVVHLRRDPTSRLCSCSERANQDVARREYDKTNGPSRNASATSSAQKRRGRQPLYRTCATKDLTGKFARSIQACSEKPWRRLHAPPSLPFWTGVTSIAAGCPAPRFRFHRAAAS